MANDAPIEPSTLAAQQAEADEHAPPTSLLRLCLLAMVVGIVTGIGAVVFRALIGLVHNVLFLGSCRSPTIPACSRRHPLGAVGHPGAGDRRNRRHLHRQQLRTRGEGPRRPRGDGRDLLQSRRDPPGGRVAKSLASALAIGSGAAVGREGPIIQIGSALGSTSARSIRMAMGSGSSWSPLAPAPASPRHSTHRSAACCSPSS